MKCGEPVKVIGTEAAADTPVVDENSSRYRKIGIIAVAAGVIIIAAVVVALIFGGGRGYRKVIDEFFEAAIEDMDIDDILELYPREIARNAYSRYSVDIDEGDLYLEMEFGDRRGRPDINIVHNEKYDDERLDSLRQELMMEYGISPTEARYVVASYSFDTRSGNEQTGAVEFNLIKLGRSWYLIEAGEADMSNLA